MAQSYYAVSAKVHALYGRRLKSEDYHQLMNMKTVPEAATFLQSHPGYSDRLTGLNLENIHREALENDLWGDYVDEYRRIFSFVPMNDKELMRFPLYKAEQSAILSSMRMLTSTAPLTPVATWDTLLSKESSLDMAALESASSFQEIADAASNTIYASALQRIASGENKSPSLAFVDNMMQVVYFAKLYKILNKNYTGQVKAIIKQSLDQDTDLINLIQFLRLKRYFSPEDIELYSFPLPCSAKLSESYMQQLISAPDYEAAWNLVLDGPYGTLFHSITASGMEAYLYNLQYHFARRQMRAATPTIFTPIAYLTLKEIELRTVISIIECIRYHGNPYDYVTLIGVDQ